MNRADYGFGMYRMVVNLREGFIFAFFTSEEPFAKIKTAKMSKCIANELSFNHRPSLNYIVANRTVSASVPLMAIAEALQAIEILRKHRRTNQTAAQGRERDQSYYERPGYGVLFSPH